MMLNKISPDWLPMMLCLAFVSSPSFATEPQEILGKPNCGVVATAIGETQVRREFISEFRALFTTPDGLKGVSADAILNNELFEVLPSKGSKKGKIYLLELGGGSFQIFYFGTYRGYSSSAAPGRYPYSTTLSDPSNSKRFSLDTELIDRLKETSVYYSTNGISTWELQSTTGKRFYITESYHEDSPEDRKRQDSVYIPFYNQRLRITEDNPPTDIVERMNREGISSSLTQVSKESQMRREFISEFHSLVSNPDALAGVSADAILNNNLYEVLPSKGSKKGKIYLLELGASSFQIFYFGTYRGYSSSVAPGQYPYSTTLSNPSNSKRFSLDTELIDRLEETSVYYSANGIKTWQLQSTAGKEFYITESYHEDSPENRNRQDRVYIPYYNQRLRITEDNPPAEITF